MQAITITDILIIMELMAMVILFLDLITVTEIMAVIEAAILFTNGIMAIVILFMVGIMVMAAIEEDSETAGNMDIAAIPAIAASADKCGIIFTANLYVLRTYWAKKPDSAAGINHPLMI